jgi:hypothetical protein
MSYNPVVNSDKCGRCGHAALNQLYREDPGRIRLTLTRIGWGIALGSVVLTCTGVMPGEAPDIVIQRSVMLVFGGLVAVAVGMFFPKTTKGKPYLLCGVCKAEWPMP